MKIFKCNECNTFLKDMNPNTTSVLFTEDHIKASGIKLKHIACGITESTYMCPNCLTDRYLQDVNTLPLIYVNPFNKKNKQIKEDNPLDVEFLSTACFIVERKIPCGKQFDYVVDNTCITQRCGKSIRLLKLLKKTKCNPLDYSLKFKINEYIKRKVRNVETKYDNYREK